MGDSLLLGLTAALILSPQAETRAVNPLSIVAGPVP